jgi:SAM-dependent methyltransferase
MGLQLARKKPKHLLLSIFYRLAKLLPWHAKWVLRLFCDLEWIFARLALESSYSYYKKKGVVPEHRLVGFRFLRSFLQPNFKVLDLACGNGFLTTVIAKEVEKVVGVDRNPMLIDAAKRNNKFENVEFHCKDLDSFLKEDDTVFDLIIMSNILEHIDNPGDFLASITHRFKYFYIDLPDWDGSYLNTIRLESGSKLIYTDADHVSEFDRDELLDIFNKAQLSILGSDYRLSGQFHWLKGPNS